MKKKVLALLLTLLMMFGMLSATTFANEDGQAYDFADMPNNWSTAALKRAVDNGLLKGFVIEGKTLINADAPLKRAEMAAVVNRAFGAAKTAELKGVTDVPSTAWYASDMAKAVMMGTFVKDAKMRPESNITRQEAFVVLARAFKTISADTDLKVLDNFTDKADISTWAQKDLNAMAAAGYINGSPDGKLNPKANITRAEFAAVMDNLVKQYIDKPREVTDVVASGNVLVRIPGVALKNITVKGDLIITDGVGDGDVTLDNVNVEGRTVVRGGGENSIIIKGNSDLGKVVVCKVDGKVRIAVEAAAGVEVIYVDDGSDDVLVEGIIGTLEVAGDNITAIATKAFLTNAIVSGDNSKIVLRTGSTLKDGTISGNLSGITVDEGATAEKIIVSGSDAKVEGSGTVKNVEVKADGDNASITTPNTKIKTSEGAEGVAAAGGAPIESGTLATNNNAGTWIVTPPASGGGRGSSSAKISAINIATTPDVFGGADNDAVVTVTLTTATAGADIYYTTDGSTPTASSTKYTAPFEVDTDNTEGETVTIKAVGIKSGYTNSAVAEKEIVFKPISISTDSLTYFTHDGSGTILQHLYVTISGATFAEEAEAQNSENWLINTGMTNFKLYGIKRIDDKKVEITFSLKIPIQGSGRGTVTVQAKAAAVAAGVDTNVAKVVMYESVFYTKTGEVTDINPAIIEFLSGNQFWVPIAPEEIAVTEFTFKDNGVDKKASFDGSGWNVGVIAERIQLTIAEPTVTKEKQYNGTTVAQVTAGELTGVSAGDDVSVNATANFNDIAVGTGKTITVVYTLSGSDAYKYTAPVSWTTDDGLITKKTLGFSGLLYKTIKEYDGTTAVTLLTHPTLSGVVEGETVNVDVDINYDTAVVGSDKRITTVFTISGEHAGNYIKPNDHHLDGCEIVVAADPTPGNGGVITAESIPDKTLTLNWAKASDNFTAEANLKYFVYQSDSNNIDTVQNAVDNGTLLNDGGTADINTYNVTGLNVGTTYYFNVIVADETGYKAAYTTLNAAWKSSATDLISVAGQKDNSPGGGTGEAADVAVTWQVNVDNAKATLALADIAVEDRATFEMYADEYYTTKIEEANPLSLNVGNTIAYIRVDAEDGTTSKFYKVTVKRALPAQSGSPEFTAGTPATYGTQLTVGPGTLTTTTKLSYWWYRSVDEIHDAYDSPVFGVSTTNYTPIEADIGYYLIVVVVTKDATGSGILVTDAPVAKAAGPAFTAEYAGTFPSSADAINLTGLGASTGNLEAAVAIDGTDYTAYAPLAVNEEGKATITGLTGVTASTKVKVRVKETTTHKAGADKEITVTQEAIIPAEPDGDLLHAAAGSGFTGVLYERDGSIYYNQVDTAGTWGTETLIGTGSEGRLAIDSTGKPHVAYTTGVKIGYRMYDGSAWADEVLIESMNGGSCFKPDIAVDSNGYAHITYTDTRGSAGDPYNEDDIMYAVDNGEGFDITLIYRGQKSYISGADQDGMFYKKGSKIALDDSNNYYIIAHQRSWYKWMSGSSNTYSIVVNSSLGIGGTVASSSDIYDIYDLTSSGSKVIALYNHSGLKTAELTESGGTITFDNPQTLTGGTVSSVATDGTNIVVGGINSGKLQTFYNGTATVYDGITVQGTIVSVSYVNGKFYAAYTNNSDGRIKMVEIGTP